MVPTALSSTPASSIISELSSFNPVFAAMTDAQRLSILNMVQQDVCNLYNNAGKDDYSGNNYTDPLEVPGQTAPGEDTSIRAGVFTAILEGTPVVFQRNGEVAPFDTTPILILPPGISSVNPNDDVDSLTRDGFTGYAMVTTSAWYLAKEVT